MASKGKRAYSIFLIVYAIVCLLLFMWSFCWVFVREWSVASSAGSVPFDRSKGGLELWMGLTLLANFFSGVPLSFIGMRLMGKRSKWGRRSGMAVLMVAVLPTIALCIAYFPLIFPLTPLFYLLSWTSLVLGFIGLKKYHKLLDEKESQA